MYTKPFYLTSLFYWVDSSDYLCLYCLKQEHYPIFLPFSLSQTSSILLVLLTLPLLTTTKGTVKNNQVVYCCISTRTSWLCFACKKENCLIQTWLVIILFYTRAVYVRKSKRFENPSRSYHLIRAAQSSFWTTSFKHLAWTPQRIRILLAPLWSY